jgi:hypothetical protein
MFGFLANAFVLRSIGSGTEGAFGPC